MTAFDIIHALEERNLGFLWPGLCHGGGKVTFYSCALVLNVQPEGTRTFSLSSVLDTRETPLCLLWQSYMA